MLTLCSPPYRDRRKREKEAERRQKADAEEAARAEEAAQKAAEDAVAAEAAAEARKMRQAEKKATQRERSRLRALCAGMGVPSCLSVMLSRPLAGAACTLHVSMTYTHT